MLETRAEPNAVKGILLVVLATLFFASGDVLTKQLATLYGVALVVAMRYGVNVGILGVALGPRMGKSLWATNRTLLVFLRGLCLAAASLTMALALRLMPVGETVAIVYLAPIAVMIFAAVLLGERVSPVGWMAAMAGFGGVLLIVRPGTGLDPVGVTLALINAGLSTTYHLLTRVLARTETTLSMLFNTAVVGTVAFWALMPFQPPLATPSLADFGLMVVVGVAMTAGHFLFTAAYREAPASVLAPVNYLHLVWAAILGWLVFGHVPDPVTGIGMGLVTAAGVAVALRAQFGRKVPEIEGEA
ncbi:MAG: DMT family transporter [bacterium]